MLSGRSVGQPIARPDHEIVQMTPAAFAFDGRGRRGGFHDRQRGLVGLQRRGRRSPVGLPRFRLRLTGGLEQFRVNGELKRNRMTENLRGGGANRLAKLLLQVFAEEPVWHADDQLVVFPGKPGSIAKPKTKTRLADPADKGLVERGNDVAITDLQGASLARIDSPGVVWKLLAREVLSRARWEGPPGTLVLGEEGF